MANLDDYVAGGTGPWLRQWRPQDPLHAPLELGSSFCVWTSVLTFVWTVNMCVDICVDVGADNLAAASDPNTACIYVKNGYP